MLIALLAILLTLPAQARTIRFSGHDWEVKNGPSIAPGPNRWSDSSKNVWVDTKGRLHLKITKRGGVWSCAEVFIKRPTTFGLHRFLVIGRPKDFDPAVTFGAFLYQSDAQEIDIEFARWSDAADSNDAQFVVQPYQRPENIHRFSLPSETVMNLDIDWRSDRVGFALRRDPRSLVRVWRWKGNIPHLRRPQVRLNLWLDQGKPPGDGREAEIIIASVKLP